MTKPISLFWWRWLLVVTTGVMIFSLGFVIVPDTMQSLFNLMFFSSPDTPFSDDAYHYINFTYGVLGAVMFGWMITLMGILISTFRHGEPQAWNIITASIVIWYGVDSAFSLWMGFPQNAVFNTLFLIMFIIPLAATYRQFHPEAA